MNESKVKNNIKVCPLSLLLCVLSWVPAGLPRKAYLSTSEMLSGAGEGVGMLQGQLMEFLLRAPPILRIVQNVFQSAELARLKARMSGEGERVSQQSMALCETE